jgi:hypothetical protein
VHSSRPNDSKPDPRKTLGKPTKKLLEVLGLLRPNRDSSMGYDETKQKIYSLWLADEKLCSLAPDEIVGTCVSAAT